jgi:hypothetical protein
MSAPDEMPPLDLLRTVLLHVERIEEDVSRLSQEITDLRRGMLELRDACRPSRSARERPAEED